MERRVFVKSPVRALCTAAAPIMITLFVIGLVMVGLRQADAANRAEGLRLLEEALMRAAVHSYAVEGRFPESLELITERYGIFIDTSRFLVHYDVFAANILPDIRVFELNR
jgi:hypothetical protein